MTFSTDTQAAIVLVAESDVLVRMSLAAYLRECGFTVVEAGDTNEAIQILDQSGLRVDALLADVGLPGAVDAFGLVKWVRSNRPGVQIMLAATPGSAAAKAGTLCEQGPHLTRPYDPQIVEKQIRQLLGARLPSIGHALRVVR
jgi:DNA-binding response OmpR family regulator